MDDLNEKLANLIFPDITETIEDLEKKYPKRDYIEGREVTRFAPSPTGFLHIGGLFGALIDMVIANKSNGTFILRIEDTDKKREVVGGVGEIISKLNAFDIKNDEGVISDDKEIGKYGPYKQSERKYIYQVCAKELIKRGRAYPCFCTENELELLRQSQEKNKQIPGYYGTFARCRNYTVKEAIEKIEKGEHYVIRFRSLGSHLRKIKFNDIIRGKIEMAENDQDIVIIKSDGLPTYHFAHAVDDHFMRTTIALRGEEWIPSTALHLELFDALGFENVKYAHTPTMMKNDGVSKRKLSKRKDPEAAVSYFIEEGYPKESVIEYLLTIINSDFEPWRRANIDKPWKEFNLRLNKLNSSGALFDIIKLKDISKDIIGRMSADTLLQNVLKWSQEYDKRLYNLLNSDLTYALKVFSIERDNNSSKIRKDIAKYNEVLDNISYMYEELYKAVIKDGYNFDLKAGKLRKEDIKQVLCEYLKIHKKECTKEEWFESVKKMAEKLGYCTNMKEYKQNEEAYKGSISDVTGFIRVAITNRRNSPDIYSIMNVLGENVVKNRIENVLNNF